MSGPLTIVEAYTLPLEGRRPHRDSGGPVPLAIPVEGSANTRTTQHRYVAVRRERHGEVDVITARDVRLQRTVIIHRTITPVSPEDAAAFLRGAGIAGALDHPTIDAILELGVDVEGHAYHVSRERTTRSLAALVADGAPRRQLLGAFVEVCQAIAHAHDHGVAHADLGAECVRVGALGELQITGWDAALIAPGPLADAWGEAPPRPAAPTGAAEDEPGPARDVRALGHLLERMLGDELPRFPELAAVIGLATDPDPRQRLASARVLADEVTHYLDGQRDHAARRRLAGDLVEQARDLARAGAIPDALAAAHHALALDPLDAAAADLVGALMFEVPRSLPVEAHDAMARTDAHAARAVTRVAGISTLGAAAFLPLLAIHHPRQVWLLVLMTATAIGLALWRLRSRGGEAAWSLPFNLGLALLLAFLSRAVSPFIAVSTLATLAALIGAMQPAAPSWRLLIPLYVAPVLVPWLVEALGILTPTATVTAGQLHVAPEALVLEPLAAELELLLFTVTAVVAAGLVARRLARVQREVHRQVLTRAWLLRHVATTDPGRLDRDVVSGAGARRGGAAARRRGRARRRPAPRSRRGRRAPGE